MGRRQICRRGFPGLTPIRAWFGVPPLGGSNGLDRLKPGLQAVSGFMVPMHLKKKWGLSMNLTQRSSRRDEMKVAVGFNPRLGIESMPAVAERRLDAGVHSNAPCVATRRRTVSVSVIRGLKPAAAITASLRKALFQDARLSTLGFLNIFMLTRINNSERRLSTARR